MNYILGFFLIVFGFFIKNTYEMCLNLHINLKKKKTKPVMVLGTVYQFKWKIN